MVDDTKYAYTQILNTAKDVFYQHRTNQSLMNYLNIRHLIKARAVSRKEFEMVKEHHNATDRLLHQCKNQRYILEYFRKKLPDSQFNQLIKEAYDYAEHKIAVEAQLEKVAKEYNDNKNA